jgi:protein-S-isoprenylcysteine O-methyltransferase Ste14
MENKKDSPGVYLPPPLFYVAIFLIAVFLEHKVPVNDSMFHLQITKLAGILFIAISFFFLVTGLRSFIQSKNTLVLIKPASSLQTTGIFSITRNPMYCGLSILYFAITCLIGNWWNIILFPFLVLIIQEYVIKREEKYLERAFGEEYLNYKNRVRRWL